ncbi:hypothetical protein SAMN05216474_1602 [Lishizhenia tianjinensis]|uniref:PH domain-containing protein n=1 Tax=Lishizhenia tianjinensis TaxID=477690 RepID=A0A1I6ZT32_9FLAO|nr:hypothetical protein [Lishizhenia tianjinensis]SFT65863.1 hypothetical protein SAMN05216474_1602 [Lishizhenia tianjinensis]
MEKRERIHFANRIAHFQPDKKQLFFTNNTFHFLLLSNGIAILGALPFLSFIGTTWEELSIIHILIVSLFFLITSVVSIGYHKSAKNKNLLIFDGNKKFILRGKEGIAFDKIKAVGVKRHVHYDEYDNYTYSYELLLQLKNGKHLSIMNDENKYDIDILKSWVKKILQTT